MTENDVLNKFPWLAKIEHILICCGLNNIWNNHSFINSKWLKVITKQKVYELFVNDWYALIESSEKALFYKIFKTSFGYEDYLHKTPTSLLVYLIRFRTGNHRLPIEIGNWERIPINERMCQTCNKLEDEFHYLFECTIYDRERKQYLKRYYYNNPSTFKLQKLMSSEKDFINLCKFCKTILSNNR